MKDFDWVIGKQVGELTILSYTPPFKRATTPKKLYLSMQLWKAGRNKAKPCIERGSKVVWTLTLPIRKSSFGQPRPEEGI